MEDHITHTLLLLLQVSILIKGISVATIEEPGTLYRVSLLKHFCLSIAEPCEKEDIRSAIGQLDLVQGPSPSLSEDVESDIEDVLGEPFSYQVLPVDDVLMDVVIPSDLPDDVTILVGYIENSDSNVTLVRNMDGTPLEVVSGDDLTSQLGNINVYQLAFFIPLDDAAEPVDIIDILEDGLNVTVCGKLILCGQHMFLNVPSACHL